MTINVCIEKSHLDGLSKEQIAAVNSTTRFSKIVAAAGAGKTRTIVRKILRFLSEGENPRGIVAFTFTEKAANELKQRIYEDAERCLDLATSERIGEVTASTIHGFCLQFLRDMPAYSNYSVLDENQEMAFLLHNGQRLGIEKRRGYQEDCAKFLRTVYIVFDERIDRRKLKAEASGFLEKLEKYEALLRQHRFLTFGLLIENVIREIENDQKRVQWIQHLIVDEYQDINHAQKKLIELIGRSAKDVTGVGDSRQCIYEWRGSDPKIFEEKFFQTNAEAFPLSVNYRSVSEVIAMANRTAKVFEEQSLRSPMTPQRKERGVTIAFGSPREETQAREIAEGIKVLVKRGFRFSDIAILLRSVTTSGPAIIAAFEREKIPYVVAGRVGLFERLEASAVGKILAWAADSSWPEGRYQARQYLQDDELINSAIRDWEAETDIRVSRNSLELFAKRIKAGKYKDFTQAFQDLLSILQLKRVNALTKTGAVIWANLGRFNSLLTDFESPTRLWGRKPNWKYDLRDLAYFMAGYAMDAYEKNQNDLQHFPDAVQLMTIHQAKGLEWPIVFVPSLDSKRFPSTKMGSPLDVEIPETLFPHQRYRGDLNAERKLFYVAVTRAQEALILSRFEQSISERGRTTLRKPSPLAVETGIIFRDKLLQKLPREPLVKLDRREILRIFSPSEIISYMKCPFCYWLRYECGFQPGISEEVGFGKSVHSALHMIADAFQKKGKVTKRQAEEMVSKTFHLPFARKFLTEKSLNRAKEMVLRHLETDYQTLKTVRDIEARVEFSLGSTYIIAGRVDLILTPTGNLEIWDYKTATLKEDPNLNNETASVVQLQIYTAGLRKLREDVSAAKAVFLKSNKKVSINIAEPAINRTVGIARNCVEKIARNEHRPPHEGNGCGFCDFKEFCGFCRRKSKDVLDKFTHLT